MGLAPSLLLLLGLAGCGTVAARPRPTPRPVILAEAAGKCPLHPAPGANGPIACRRTRAGNGVTGQFVAPLRRPWGIAYSYACGDAQRGFYVVVGLPVMDGQLPETGFQRPDREGRGFVMETGKANGTIQSLPNGYGAFQNVEVASACAWHVRAVEGTRAEVAARVPALPHP